MSKKQVLISGLQRSDLSKRFLAGLYDYQMGWYLSGLSPDAPVRNILKSRAIGATWYFVREMLLDAVTTGRNQVLIAPNEGMAQAARRYLTRFAAASGVAICYDEIIFQNGAGLHFSYPGGPAPDFADGNVYMDEYAWVDDFSYLTGDILDIATHSGCRQTWYTSPSSYRHGAFAFWSGGEPVMRQFEPGQFVGCSDGQLRQVVTLEMAIAGGFDRIDAEKLRSELSAAEWRQLCQCEWVSE